MAPSPLTGSCVWLTGLSASGKTTISTMLAAALREAGRPATLLDGDAVRARLSPALGFSRHERHDNVQRIAALARSAVDEGAVAICAVVSPYRGSRAAARHIVGAGSFVEVYVSTPLAVCEARDPKGLYARARRGELRGVTGIDDPYEPPVAADVVLDTLDVSAADDAARLLSYLKGRGMA